VVLILLCMQLACALALLEAGAPVGAQEARALKAALSNAKPSQVRRRCRDCLRNE
jgi:hypothetical protein